MIENEMDIRPIEAGMLFLGRGTFSGNYYVLIIAVGAPGNGIVYMEGGRIYMWSNAHLNQYFVDGWSGIYSLLE